MPPSLAPGVQFLALAAAAVPLHLALRRRAVPAAAGAAVMALGIFGIAALPDLAPPLLRQPFALALLVLWLLLALAFAQAWREGRDPGRGSPQVFTVGTWPAATAVTALLIDAALPGWAPLAAALGAVAALLWVWFLMQAGDAMPSLIHTGGEPLDGTVLLATVATQGIALLAERIPWPPFPALAFALVELGAFFYAALLALILRSLLRTRAFRLAEDWRNGNCIWHGAASITGLAAVTSGQVPPAVCLGIWLYSAAVFLLVEAMEVLRLGARWRLYGWRGALVYDASQWARNFTFGMFYAFTRSDLAQFGAAAGPNWARALQGAVLQHGAWAVLGLLLIEAALFAAAPRARG